MTAASCDSATVHAIYRVRSHSRACQDLSARAILIRVERQMVAFLLAAQDSATASRAQDEA